MTYMLLLNCALKLVEEIILYYDARSKIHQIRQHSLYHDQAMGWMTEESLFGSWQGKAIFLFLKVSG